MISDSGSPVYVPSLTVSGEVSEVCGLVPSSLKLGMFNVGAEVASFPGRVGGEKTRPGNEARAEVELCVGGDG